MSAPRASKPRPDSPRTTPGSREPASTDRAARQGALVRASDAGSRPASDDALPCVWMSAGLLAYKLCARDFDCDHCPLDSELGGRCSSGRAPSPRFEVRRDLRYSPGHAWVKELGAFRARCGIDGFGVHLLQRLSAVVLPALDTKLQCGAPACWLVDDAEPIALRAPLGGTVVRINDAARGNPTAVTNAPYDDGWLFELEFDRRANDDAGLLDADSMRRHVARDARRLRRHLRRRAGHGATHVGATLPDGGRPLREPRDVLGRGLYHRLVERLLR